MSLLITLLGCGFSASTATAPVEPKKPAPPKLTREQISQAYFYIEPLLQQKCTAPLRKNFTHGDSYSEIRTPVQLCEIVGPARDKAPELWYEPQFYCLTEDCAPSEGNGFTCFEQSALSCAALELAAEHVALVHKK